MKLKRVIQLDDAAKTCRVVKVYWNADASEYVCELFISGGHYEPADYFTDDYEDAIGTAKQMCIDPETTRTEAGKRIAHCRVEGFTVAQTLEYMFDMCAMESESCDILTWKFSDGSMCYYNKRRSAWVL